MIPLVKVLWKNHEREATKLRCAINIPNYFPNKVFSFPLSLVVHFEDEMF